ncbi:hypothetical protein QWZ13_13935 [Reinekea marina]|uniref:hypothetical protein n=1 Tax=Reinekea marina TaxID=1310421 RepID=UPI0025B407B3|nr:hypothetical protein [Reinekea marina]MDN3650016.1 hypothetical protein [Reinekea marina]
MEIQTHQPPQTIHLSIKCIVAVLASSINEFRTFLFVSERPNAVNKRIRLKSSILV